MPSTHEREAALFALALEKPASERTLFLNAICGADAELRARLDSLLAAHEAPESVLLAENKGVRPTMQIKFADEPADERIGQKIGRYKLLEKVGEGGCGVVYVAEQVEPVHRRVALKVIKLGMDTKAVVARFEAERQALAMMDHPNIAKVLDAGTTETGRPFFVMELVRGIRITDYCDQNNLSTPDRLDLFIKVCHAIQHAHQKGIIHRDIKPSNILVTLHDGVPVPKVIDFGIAKATEGRLTEATVYTQLHQFIGTPAYMSPEQAEMSGLDIDTRSDIYSLGVLLYELLTGKTPFDATELMAQGIDAMRRTIREREPIRPSTRIATLQDEERTATAKRHSIELPRLIHQLKGDLDWIAMKCLEKDRTRRYETANGLAADLKRHLANEPVIARPPSATYRLQKSIRRNQLVYAAGATVVVALVIGLALAATGLRQARTERNSAIQARAGEAVQRQYAERSSLEAEAARKHAEEGERIARIQAYAADINLAQQALAVNNLARARLLLERHRPVANTNSTAAPDLRGWEWRYLWDQTRPDPHQKLVQLTKRPIELSASFDGSLLALTGSGEVALYDTRTGRRVTRFSRELDDFARTRAVFARNSPVLAIVQHNNNSEILLWDSVAQKEIRRFPARQVHRFQFAQHDQTLVALSTSDVPRKNTLIAWSVADGSTLWERPVAGSGNRVGQTLAISNDGSLGVLCTENSNFTIFKTSDGSDIRTVKATSELVTALAFSPDSSQIASGSGYTDSIIRVWDVATGDLRFTLEGHRSWVGSLTFSSDGGELFSASGDQTVRRWDVAARKEIAAFRGHRAEVDGVVLAGPAKFATRAKDGSIFLWNIDQSRSAAGRKTLPIKSHYASFADDGKSILAMEQSGGLSRWNSETLTLKRRYWETLPTDHAAAPSADGKHVVLVTGSENQPPRASVPISSLQIMNLETSEKSPELLAADETLVGGGHSPDGSTLIGFVVKDGATRMVFWNFATGRRTFTSEETEFPSTSVREGFANFVVIRDHRHFKIYDILNASAPKWTLPNLGACEEVTLVTSRELAIAAYEEGFLQIYDLKTARPTQQLKGFLLGVHSVTVSADQSRLAAGSNGAEAIKLWETQTWQELITLSAPGSLYRVIQFSPDAKHLLAVNAAGDVSVWSAPSGEEIDAIEAAQAQP